MCKPNVFCIVQGPTMSVVFEEHIFMGEVMQGTCCCTRWHWGHKAPSSCVRICTCVRNDSESVRASLSASLISLKRQSSSCRVIRAGILANCVNMSKRKGILSPLGDSSSKIHQSESPSAFLCPLALGPGQVQRFLASLVGVLRQMSDRTVASTIYQIVCPPVAMWKAVLLRQASLPLSRWERW